jgi:hypothetical protein
MNGMAGDAIFIMVNGIAIVSWLLHRALLALFKYT